jgi:hypothetical protein
MLEFYDKLFISIYKLYSKHGETNKPAWISILLLSLFQSINILSVIFILFGFLYGKSLTYLLPCVFIFFLFGLVFNCARIYKIIGLQNLIDRYPDYNRKQKIHPALYFVFCLIVLAI